MEKARCLLYEANLEKRFWAEAVNTAVYLLNRTVKSNLNYRTPYELWTGTKPDLRHIRIFGSTVMTHIPREKRRKWDRKANKCILVGFSEDVKGYRIYNPSSKSITTSRDVVIIEDTKQSESLIEIEKKEEIERGSLMVDEQSNGERTTQQLDEAEAETVDDDDATDQEEDINTRKVLPVRERRPPERFGFSNLCLEDEDREEVNEILIEEALQGPERDHWEQAVREELESFAENNAWELVDPPVDGTIVKCKWVLRKKIDNENKVRYRARLVAKGCSQKYGVDYDETFSPVVRHSTLRLLFALSVQLDLKISHLNVKTAFLNGDLNEIIYMEKPNGFTQNSGDKYKVLKLKKAIYGLKQASRAWHKKIDEFFLSNGYEKSKLEPCLYSKIDDNMKVIVTVYVDDFFVFSNNIHETEKLKNLMSSNFRIKDLGIVKQCLGMRVQIDEKNNCLTLDQERYIDELLYRFDMADSKTVDTPIEMKLKLKKCIDQKGNNRFQQLTGSLMYLAVLTRPDIMFSVSYLSQFNNCNNDEHLAYAKRILRYLKSTKNFGLKFMKEENSDIEGFVDADWANNFDRKSFTGYCFMLSGSLISWCSRKQKNVTLSSTESEYVAISECCKELFYLRNLQYEITKRIYIVNLYNDSQSAQKLLKNSAFHCRTKHVDVRYHYCREMFNDKVFDIIYKSTSEMPADIFTKGLNSSKHYKFLKLMGITELN